MSFNLLIEQSGETIFELECASQDEAVNKAVMHLSPIILTSLDTEWEKEEDGENLTLTKDNIVITITEA